MTHDTPGGSTGGGPWARLGRVRLRPGRPGTRTPRSRARRRLGSAVRLVAALALAGGVYTAFAPSISADDTPKLSAAAQDGKALFDVNCITCHGRNAQGVPGRGPSLIGVGSAAVEFQVTTGRMPLARQEVQAERKPPQLSDDEARQIGQYIQELGGGPQLPEGDKLAATGDDAVSRGGELFRVNCSSCHAFAGGGGALSSGRFAPPVHEATDRQIYAAMLTGPQSMPVFGDSELTPQEKADIIAYVDDLKNDYNPGGWGLGRLGPVTEGLAIFLVGITALVFTTLWIAGKS
jgi:ubiquinol-cytochrome c reductase cytochrome c subunit